MNELSVIIHNVLVNVSDRRKVVQSLLLENLRSDFLALEKNEFVKDEKAQIIITDSLPENLENKTLLFKTRNYSVRGWGKKRLVQYDHGVKVLCDESSRVRKFYLTSTNNECLYEVCYNLILSTLGEELDLKGFHRVHGLGFSFESTGVLVVGPSGMGKSSIALQALRRDGFKLHSDESPLINKNGEMFSYPTRLALGKEVAKALQENIDSRRVFKRQNFPAKILFPVERNKVATTVIPEYIFIGKQKKGALPEIRETGRIAVFWNLILTIVVGWGIAQMAEFMLRPQALGRLTRITFKRFITAVVLASRVKRAYYFSTAFEAQKNEAALFKSFDQRLNLQIN